MYSFAQRPDTKVLDEPFYGVYLAKTNADHPGREEILQSMPVDERTVVESIFSHKDKPVVFVKNMAHHIEVTDHDYVNDITNLFLIRDPAHIIASYTRVIEKPTMRDIGIEFQYNLFSALWRRGLRPLVVDTALLLEDPESVLRHLCTHLDIPFYREMLSWETGPKPYDGIWAPHWYDNVHQSTGFLRRDPGPSTVPEELTDLYEQARTCYNKFLPFVIHP